jgi:GNAT superfamily N-acetyltransferase
VNRARNLRARLLRFVPVRASGGIGRRAGFRFLCPQGRGGSTPPSPTSSDLRTLGTSESSGRATAVLVVTPWWRAEAQDDGQKVEHHPSQSHWYGALYSDVVYAKDALVAICELVGALLSMDYPEEGWIQQVATKATHRRRGIAQALLRAAFGDLSGRGRRRAGVSTDSRTGAARPVREGRYACRPAIHPLHQAPDRLSRGRGIPPPVSTCGYAFPACAPVCT